MEKILFEEFYRRLKLNLIVICLGQVLLLVLCIICFIKLNIFITLLFFIFFVGLIVASIFILKHYYFDYKFAKQNRYETTIGTVVKFQEVLEGGDPPTSKIYTFIQDERENVLKIELIETKSLFSKNLKYDVVQPKLNEKYVFYYLPNTKIAVVAGKYKL